MPDRGAIPPVARVRDVVATIAISVVLVPASIGVLYLLRGITVDLPGPRVHEVLPLDDLPGLGWVHLPVSLAAWGMCAALLGRFVARRGLTRRTSALVLGIAVGGVLFAISAVSLFSVRQVSMDKALWAAGRLRTISPAVLLAAGAGAILGRPGADRDRPRVALTWLTAAAGALNLLSAVVPHGGGALLLQGIVPQEVPRAASAGTVAAGAGLLVVARGLARGKRRAWTMAVILLSASSVLHLLKGLDQPEAIVTGLLAVALLAFRADFGASGDPSSRGPAAAWGVAFLVGIYAYGAGALFVNRALADRPWSPGFAAVETSRALLGRTIRGSAHVGPPFGPWFPLSVALLATVGVIVTLESLLRPWRYRLQHQDRERVVAEQVVRDWGSDTLAPFTLRPDKDLFFSSEGHAFLAYTVRSGVAIVSGDPIGPPEQLRPLLGSFLAFAHARGWRLAVLGASAASLPGYRALGLRALYWGDEAVVDTSTFTLEGRAIRKVRQSVNRLDRAGYVLEVRSANEVNDALRERLSAIVEDWSCGAALGYVMSLDGLGTREDDGSVFAIGFDPAGEPQGFLHLAAHDRGRALSLSTMPRRDGTPNGFNEWLIAGTVSWSRAHDVATVSLNFAPFAQLLDPVGPVGPMRRAGRRGLLLLKSRLGLQLDNLRRFGGHFRPRRAPRYVVFETALDLPRVGLAGLRVEGYLGRLAPA